MGAFPRLTRALASAWLLGGLVLASPGCTGWPVKMLRIPAFPSSPDTKSSVLWTEPFDRLNPDWWREVNIEGQTQYEVVVLDGRSCLRAKSQGTASILLAGVQFNPDKFEWLSWYWRVDRLIEGEALERKDGSDASARVYVYFKTKGLPWNKRSLDYVWSAYLPVGTMMESAYSSSSKIIVVESGAEHLGEWRQVQRNLEDDFEEAFGGHPPEVVAIGLMTDTDNTGEEALAYFDDFVVSRQRILLPERAGAEQTDPAPAHSLPDGV